MPLTELGERVRSWRMQHSIILGKMADDLNVSSSDLSAWEVGRKPLPDDMRERIEKIIADPPKAMKSSAQKMCDLVAVLGDPDDGVFVGTLRRATMVSDILLRALALHRFHARLATGTCNGSAHAWVVCDGEILDPTKNWFHAPRKYIEDAEPPEVSTDDNL